MVLNNVFLGSHGSILMGLMCTDHFILFFAGSIAQPFSHQNNDFTHRIPKSRFPFIILKHNKPPN